MSEISRGEVEITLAGQTRTLKPTLRAFTRLGSLYPTYRDLLEKLSEGDYPAVLVVLREGLGLTDKQTQQLPDLLFSTGLSPKLLASLVDYVIRLFNAGKSAEEVRDERLAPQDDEGNGQTAAP